MIIIFPFAHRLNKELYFSCVMSGKDECRVFGNTHPGNNN
jgi:hypothetical protein